MLTILLYRNWLEFKKRIIEFILILFLLPMILHLFLSIPLSNIIEMDIRYLNWAAPGNWIVSSGIMAFVLSLLRIKFLKNDSNHLLSLLKTPLKNHEILLSIVITSGLVGIFQFFISYFLTNAFNNEYLSIVQSFSLFILVLPSIFFFATLGMLMGMFIKRDLVMICTIFFVFKMMVFAFGTFIPLESYPIDFTEFSMKIPISIIVANTQLIIQNKSFNYVGFLGTTILLIITYLISLICSFKTFRK